MVTFPDLLKRTTAHCNRRGKQLLIAVLVFGTVSIMLWILFWRVAMVEGTRAITKLVGPEGVARIEQTIESMGNQPDPQKIIDALMAEMEAQPGGVPEEKMLRAAVASLPALAPLGILLVFFGLWSWSFLLVLASGSEAPWWSMMMHALRAMPRLLALLAILLCVTVAWIPPVAVAVGAFAPAVLPFLLAAAIVVVLYLWPRLLLAPMILVQDRTRVMDAVRRSVKLSRGRWLRIAGNVIGVAAVVWLGTLVARILLNLLIQVALTLSPSAFALWHVMTYVLLVGSAYRTTFAMRLKEELSA